MPETWTSEQLPAESDRDNGDLNKAVPLLVVLFFAFARFKRGLGPLVRVSLGARTLRLALSRYGIILQFFFSLWNAIYSETHDNTLLSVFL